MKTVFVDFETYYSSADKYTLTKMSAVEYVRDARFKVHGFCMAVDNDPIAWYRDMSAFPKDFWLDAIVVAHNAKFDGFIMAERYGINPWRWVDTLGMAKAVLGSTVPKHSLSALAEHYGLSSKGVMRTDGLVDLTPWQEKELAEYCEQDTYLLREIYTRLKADFPESQWDALDWTVRAFVSPVLVLDSSRLSEASEEEKARREAFFQKPGFERERFSSNPKFAKLLEERGYPVPTKKSPRTGKDIPALALGDPEFTALLESDDETLVEICEARVAAKSTLLETRSGKLAAIGATGPWPFDVGFSGAKQTHRFSGGNGAGGNPQNFPARKEAGKVIRQSVCAPEGHLLIVGDFKAVEARIAAYLSKEKNQMAIFSEDKDPYIPFGTSYFKREITKADDKERNFAKAVILGCQYGMGAKRFQKHAKINSGQEITMAEATEAINLYRQTYGAIPAMWKYLDRMLSLMASGGKGAIHSLPILRLDGRSIVLPSGLRLQYPNLREGDDGMIYTSFRHKRLTETTVSIWGGSLLENICQALAGEICKEAILNISRACTPWGKVVGQVHDEIIAVAPEEDAPTLANIMEEEMSKSPAWWPELKLGAEVGVGPNWKEAKV